MGLVFLLLQSCTLSFHATSSSNEGPYAVQLEMEDFANQTISLVQSDGVAITRSHSDALSKIPIRFALIGGISGTENPWWISYFPRTKHYSRYSINKTTNVFIVPVDPAVPSCTEGLYLPKFLPPTPASRAQLIAYVNQTLEIMIKAEAADSLWAEHRKQNNALYIY